MNCPLLSASVVHKPHKSPRVDNRPTTSVRHLLQIELARRWKLSPRTLERWRWQGIGPQYLRVGGRILYRLEDIETYEGASVREPSSAPSYPQSNNQVIVAGCENLPRHAGCNAA